ncbi:MAG: DNA-3-methyladenine glycosylase family protein [Candidatus Thorarchaeota archaeon]
MKRLAVEGFSLDDTLSCGQSFCWTREGRGYVNADLGQVVYVEQVGDELRYETSSHPVQIRRLLGLEDPIDEIVSEIGRDDVMKKSIAHAPGLRIVRDSFYPCLISFICSIWKNIPAIQAITQRIREMWGPSYEFRGKTYFGMPTPDVLGEVAVDDLKAIGLAWRAEFIHRSTRAILDGQVEEDALREAPYEDAHRVLTSLHGVGNKVADCVLLFSLGHLDAFPIDVWIERVIQKHYGIFTEAGKTYAKKSRAARDYFGRYAGYAQEFLYYYFRTQDAE